MRKNRIEPSYGKVIIDSVLHLVQNKCSTAFDTRCQTKSLTSQSPSKPTWLHLICRKKLYFRLLVMSGEKNESLE